jgi:hypothetical protein
MFEDGTFLLSGTSASLQQNYMLRVSVFRTLSRSSGILLESGRKLMKEVCVTGVGDQCAYLFGRMGLVHWRGFICAVEGNECAGVAGLLLKSNLFRLVLSRFVCVAVTFR